MRTLIAEVLAAWRRAERLAASAEPGTPEHEVAIRASARLRDVYQDLSRSGIVGAVSDDEARDLIATLQDPLPPAI